jgi:iron complex outermembrane receptor protein
MLTNKAIALVCGCLICSSALAQESNCQITLSGTIHSDSGEKLPGATVSLDSVERSMASDIDGGFAFHNVCPGEHVLIVQFIGYKRHEIQLIIQGDTNHEVTLQQDATQLSEVVVQDKPLNTEHSQNFATLNQKQLDETAGKSLGDVIKEIPGVNTIQAGPGIVKPVIHGVHSQRILILNYGIRQEGQQWGAEHAPEIDPFIASNIVVIKDASAIKYGTDALGGVVVVNPPALPEQAGLGGSINTVLQSNGRSGTVSGLLEGGIRNHDGWGWRVQGTAKQSGDYHTPDYSLTNTGVKELNFSSAVGYHRERAGVEIFFSHFQTELGILKGTAIGNLDDLVTAMERQTPQYTGDFSYHIGEPRQEVSHNLLKLNGHIITDHGEWRIQYGFQNNNRKEYDIRIGSLSKLPAIDLQLNTHTLETEWETTKPDKRSTCIGITGMFQDNNNIPGTQRIPFIPNFNNLSTGAFAISKFYFKNVVLDLGARYDYRYYSVSGYDFKNTLYKSNLRFHNASATLGATWQIKNNERLSLNISSAWRPPHVSELYSLGTHQSAAAIEYGLLLNDSTNEVMNIKDVPFKNEQAVKWVNTYQHEWNNLKFEATVYANYIFNYIYLRPQGITQNVRGTYPYFRYTQTDALFVGTDLTATWQISPHWKLTPQASLLRASDQTHHDYLVFIPSNRFEVNLRYERPLAGTLSNVFFESRIKYIAQQTRAPRTITVRELKNAVEQDTDPLQGSQANFDFMDAPDGYTLWNLAAGFSIPTGKGRYDFRLASENTLNTRYREYTNRFRYYADDMGRNILLSIKYTF